MKPRAGRYATPRGLVLNWGWVGLEGGKGHACARGYSPFIPVPHVPWEGHIMTAVSHHRTATRRGATNDGKPRIMWDGQGGSSLKMCERSEHR